MAPTEDLLDGLEERLQNHAQAFDALLALTPAREHYGSHVVDGLDPSEQWNRKKQTKEQKRAAKRAKLDPSNEKTALDVVKEQERKRKRELGVEDEVDGASKKDAQKPGSGAGPKRQRLDLNDEASEAIRRAKAEKRKDARERKKERKNKLKAKAEARKAAKQTVNATETEPKRPVSKKNPAAIKDVEEKDDEEEEDDGVGEEGEEDVDLTDHSAADLAKIDFSGLAASDEENDDDEGNDGDDDVADASSAPSTPLEESPAFDIATNHSEASSSSSIDSHPAVSQTNSSQKSRSSSTTTAPLSSSSATVPITKSAEKSSGDMSPKLNLPKIDQAELQERLRRRIEELRAQRKADGVDGRAPRSRQELLDERRKKEEQRKAHKKELRRQAKEDEARRREEQLRGSGSPLSMTLFSPRSPPEQPANNFSFSRLAFADGSAADAALTHLADPKKRKGPQDPQTALAAAEKKQARLAGLDEAQRAELAEKDRWLHARQRAHGERVRDDTSLLKKALKRKEKQKGRSEREWKDREQAVVHGREARQKKRETNLAKRKEEKGTKGGKKGSGGSAKGKATKNKGRPGFEGRFKA